MKVLFYIIMFILLLHIISNEAMDTFHPNGVNGKDKKGCFDGGGKYIIGGKSTKNDDINKIINKSMKLSNYTNKTIYWRRTWITSFILTSMGLYCIQGKFPSPKDFLILFMFSFIVIYLVNSLYLTHYNEWASMYMKNNLYKIKKHLKRLES